MRCSLLMATYNCWELTRNCLESLWPTLLGHDCEVIIVDNASQDATRAELAKLGNRISYLPQNINLGYAGGNNLAAAHATGEFYFFINNDLVFRPGWLQPMLEVFARHADAGLVGNIQWSPRTKRYDHMGVIFDGVQPLHFGEQFLFRPFRGVTRWGAVTAACCAVKRDVFDRANGFDTSFETGGYEDIDLCLRLEEKGYRHYIANDSVVAHWVSSSSNRHLHTAQNARTFYARWENKLGRTWALWDQKLAGENYLLRYFPRPWQFGGPEISAALRKIFLANSKARSFRDVKA